MAIPSKSSSSWTGHELIAKNHLIRVRASKNHQFTNFYKKNNRYREIWEQEALIRQLTLEPAG
jgi:hypothetical protein